MERRYATTQRLEEGCLLQNTEHVVQRAGRINERPLNAGALSVSWMFQRVCMFEFALVCPALYQKVRTHSFLKQSQQKKREGCVPSAKSGKRVAVGNSNGKYGKIVQEDNPRPRVRGEERCKAVREGQ